MIKWSDPSTLDKRGKPKVFRERFSEGRKGDAEKRLAQLERDTDIVGVSGLSFNAREKADYFGSRQILDFAGHDTVLLVEIAREYVRNHPMVTRRAPPIEELLAEFLTYKVMVENRRAVTVANLKRRIEAWMAWQAILTLHDVNEASLKALLARRGVSATTRINDASAVSAFLSWLHAERWRGGNELLDLRKPQTDARAPSALTAQQVGALLRSAQNFEDGRLLPYFALCTLAGLRPGEAATTDPSQVKTSARRPIVRVSTGKKRRRIRAVPLSKAFIAWWNVVKVKPSPLFDAGRDRWAFDRIRQNAGLIDWTGNISGKRKLKFSHWQDDICRHTWISMQLELTQDENTVALQAGNSVSIIHEHYLSLMDQDEAEAIAALRPKK